MGPLEGTTLPLTRADHAKALIAEYRAEVDRLNARSAEIQQEANRLLLEKESAACRKRQLVNAIAAIEVL